MFSLSLALPCNAENNAQRSLLQKVRSYLFQNPSATASSFYMFLESLFRSPKQLQHNGMLVRDLELDALYDEDAQNDPITEEPDITHDLYLQAVGGNVG